MTNLFFSCIALLILVSGCNDPGCGKCGGTPSCWECGTSDSLESLDYTKADVAAMVEGTWQGDYDDPEYGPFAIQFQIALGDDIKAGVIVAEQGCEVPVEYQRHCDGFIATDAVTATTLEPSVWSLKNGTIQLAGSPNCEQPTAHEGDHHVQAGCPTFEIIRNTATEPDGGGYWSVQIIPAANGKLWAVGSDGLVEIGARTAP